MSVKVHLRSLGPEGTLSANILGEEVSLILRLTTGYLRISPPTHTSA
jgi:hypothetical protein